MTRQAKLAKPATKKMENLAGHSTYRPDYRTFSPFLLPFLRLLLPSSLPWFSWTFDAVLPTVVVAPWTLPRRSQVSRFFKLHYPKLTCPVLNLFRYHNRNRIGCREGILEGIVEHLFLVPPGALGAIEVVVMRFAFRIGIHFNCSDPALNAAIADAVRDAESRRNFAVRMFGAPAEADWEHSEPPLAALRVKDQPT
jgi:hypothetical protein